MHIWNKMFSAYIFSNDFSETLEARARIGGKSCPESCLLLDVDYLPCSLHSLANHLASKYVLNPTKRFTTRGQQPPAYPAVKINFSLFNNYKIFVSYSPPQRRAIPPPTKCQKVPGAFVESE